MLRPAIERANVELAKDGIAPIGPITFHSLRRTAASLRCACGGDVAYAAAQLGHTDARFTLRVYTQATKRRERLSGAHLRAYDRAIEWAQMGTTTSESVCWLLQRQQKTPPLSGAFRGADEGTRTLDLLHGKCEQTFAPVRSGSLKRGVCSGFVSLERTAAHPSERRVQPLQPL